MTRLCRKAAVLLRCLASLMAVSCVAHAAQEDLNDLTARLQFDYYAADPRSLQQDLDALTQLAVSDPSVTIKRYYQAYGRMKLAELLGVGERGKARESAQACAREAEEAATALNTRVPPRERARNDTLRAELLAIQAACMALDNELAFLPGASTVTLAILAEKKAREQALQLAPNNPRVQLLDAIRLQRQASNDEDRAVANRKLATAVDRFDAQGPSEADLPDWGQAEALAWLAYSQLAQGERLAARNSAERSLVLAPDYVWARTLLKQAATGP